MPKLHVDWSDGRYSTRLLTDEEAAQWEASGSTVVYLDDQVYAAYVRDCERDAIWQVFWRAICNEQYMRRREAELQPLEAAEREIERLKNELARAERMSKHFEEETTRLRAAVRGHVRENREWTCVFPQPGCDVELLPPAWRESAHKILAKYNPAIAAEGMRAQGCCCGHEHQRLHDATVIQLRRAGFIVEHDSDEDLHDAAAQEHRAQYTEYTCVYPQPGCQVDALPEEWRDLAREILGKYRPDRTEGSLKYQGCCCEYGQHRLLDDADAKRLRAAGFLVENDTEIT
ncbi:MAG TPA: hypothetical protein VLE97_06295 [Gaiellaceae bacterium]|nr:hypothetical protein [Gaiellaceae bacterium]